MIIHENDFNKLACAFIKNIRKRNNVTETELAGLLNLSQQQISRYENGKTQLTLNRLNQYLNVFGVNWCSFIKSINENIQ